MPNKYQLIRTTIFLVDVLMSILSGWVAFYLRFNFFIPEKWSPQMLPIIFWLTGSQLLFFLLFKIHKGAIVRFSIDDIQKILFAIITSILFICVANFASVHIFDPEKQRVVPLSILIIGHLGTLFLIISSRIAVRNLYHYRYPLQSLDTYSNQSIWEGTAEKLLGREPILLESESVKVQLLGKTVLVTGAAGSIGRELCRQLTYFPVKKLILLDQAESPLYDLEMGLTKVAKQLKIEMIIADIRNKDRLRSIFSQFKPDIVYHAAAYKHVPMMEKNPMESILTNVFGTRNVADLAAEFEVEKCIIVSTDKAVNPTSIMGASKRLAEIYVQSFDTHLLKIGKKQPRFVTTRFGNVLGSDGSVFLLFQKQIAAGGPITVTHPEVTRFFMTIPEASQLVLEAGAMGQGGEIYVFDMGKAVRIIDLAQQMIDFYYQKTGRKIELKLTGLRPGEKLYEEVLHELEETMATHHAKILIGKVQKYDYEVILPALDRIRYYFEQQNTDEVVRLIKAIIPEYKSQNSTFERLDEAEQS